MGATLYPHWREAVKRLVDGGITYGSVVPRSQIVALCQMQEPRTVAEVKRFELKLMNAIANIKAELLREHQMWLVTDNRGSFVVVAPQDQTRYAVAEGTKAIAETIRKTQTVLFHTNTSQLTTEQRKQNADAQAKLSALAGMHRGGRREMLALTESKPMT